MLNKNLIFKIENEEHSKAVQTFLFSKGYKWLYSGTKVLYTDKKYLIVKEDRNYITWNDREDLPHLKELEKATLDYTTETIYKDFKLTIETKETKESLEIKKIEEEMRSLADRLKALKETPDNG